MNIPELSNSELATECKLKNPTSMTVLTDEKGNSYSLWLKSSHAAPVYRQSKINMRKLSQFQESIKGDVDSAEKLVDFTDELAIDRIVVATEKWSENLGEFNEQNLREFLKNHPAVIPQLAAHMETTAVKKKR